MCDIQLSPNLLPHRVQLINGDDKLDSHINIVTFCENLTFRLAKVIAVEAIFKRERMRDLELFPSYNPRSSDFVRFNSEPAVFIIEHVGFLCEDPRQQSDDGPTQKSTIGCGVTSVEKTILFLGMTV